MPVSVGNEIQASQYNALRSVVNSILNTNYGQALISTSAQAGTTLVSSDKKRDLFLDIQRTHVHHTASLNGNLAIPPSGVTIAANESQNYNQSTGALSSVTNGEQMGYNSFEAAVTVLSDFTPSTVDIWPVGNFSLGTALSSSRSTPWGGTGHVQSIFHIVQFTFPSLTARNQYFNAGGELRFSASLIGGIGAKGYDWANLLSSIGTIRFNKWRLTANSGTIPANSGFDGLTGTYRTLLTRSGSGVYADNQYTVEGRIESSTVLRFRIRFNDADEGNPPPEFPGTGIDEFVVGTITSSINTFRPNSSFVFNSSTVTAVSLPAPSISTSVGLAVNTMSVPS